MNPEIAKCIKNLNSAYGKSVATRTINALDKLQDIVAEIEKKPAPEKIEKLFQELKTGIRELRYIKELEIPNKLQECFKQFKYMDATDPDIDRIKKHFSILHDVAITALFKNIEAAECSVGRSISYSAQANNFFHVLKRTAPPEETPNKKPKMGS